MQSEFEVHKSWWVQDITGSCRNHSAVLCVEVLLFGDRKRRKTTRTTTKQRKSSLAIKAA
jgi:hypothetical protein